MRIPCLSVAFALLVAGSAAMAQANKAVPKKPPQFVEVVTEKFDAWDADDDGTLTAVEIDKACVDGKIKGSEAAAVAALKRIVRSDKYELPALTREYLAKLAASDKKNADAKAVKVDADREDSTERDGAKIDDATPAPRPRVAPSSTAKLTTRPNFQRGFETCMTRIEKSDRALFKSDRNPTIDHCHQGPLGDCFFVSVVGAAVKKDAAALKDMIHQRAESDGGGYSVRFGSGREVKCSALTDAEIAISSTTSDKSGDEGLWLAVLEKAYGTSRVEDAPDRFEMESATDAIAKGGSTATVIRALTGHATERITLKRRYRTPGLEQYDTNKRLLSPQKSARIVMLRAEGADTLAAKVRDKVPAALKASRLVATGTGDDNQPPGISGKHAYAVIEYDEKNDSLTLWNPHGNNFRLPPGKEPGILTGYSTTRGMFQIPMKDFVRVFNNVTIETEKKAAGMDRGGSL